MLSRIRKLWKLTRKDPEALKRLEGLSDDDMARIPEVGDGNAVFFGPGTLEEEREEIKKKKGLKGIFGL